MNRDSEPGASFLRTEPPDVCFWKVVGDVSANDLRRLFALQAQFAVGRDHIFVLVDLSKITGVSAEARKACVEKREDIGLRGVAIFGATFRFRVIAQAVSTAGNLLAGRTNTPVRFFGTEAQARAWLDERRATLLKESSQPTFP